MAGNINSFKSSFNTDLARPSRFDVNIPIPLALASYITTARNLSYRCESVEMPGRGFETLAKKIGSAPVEKFPYQTNYKESTFTFIVSDDMNEKIFFDAWMDLINPSTDYNFQYKANYAVDVSVNQYDVTGNLTYAAVLKEAYPSEINQLDLEWGSDGYHKLAVVFTYKQWNNNTVSAFSQSIKDAALNGLLNNITGV
jgi:hypothetical protein